MNILTLNAFFKYNEKYDYNWTFITIYIYNLFYLFNFKLNVISRQLQFPLK